MVLEHLFLNIFLEKFRKRKEFFKQLPKLYL